MKSRSNVTLMRCSASATRNRRTVSLAVEVGRRGGKATARNRTAEEGAQAAGKAVEARGEAKEIVGRDRSKDESVVEGLEGRRCAREKSHTETCQPIIAMRP